MIVQNKIKGFSLLEVLISTFITSISFLWIITSVLKGYQQAEGFYWYALASSELIALAEISAINNNEYKKTPTEFLKNLLYGRSIIEKNKIKIFWYSRDGQNYLIIDGFYSG